MSNDERIRAAGFRILRRPYKGTAIWERDGVVRENKEALAIAIYESREEQRKKRDGIKVS